MGKSSIEWTDETDNIITVEGGGWWCRKCSEGCDNCYAEGVNDMNYFKGNHLKYSGAAPQLKLKTDIIDGWARQRRPRRHFVASMTDVFGEWVPQEWINRYLDGMAAAPLQTFQVLTKRARRMRETVKAWLELRGLPRVPKNIHLGISAENQKWFDIRINDLLEIPSIHFLSCEPLIGSISLTSQGLLGPDDDMPRSVGYMVGKDDGKSALYPTRAEALSKSGIDWVIVGGESGPKARPMHPDWARDLRDQCQAASIPFMFKQWGSHIEVPAIQKEGDFGFSCTEGTFRTCVFRKINKKVAGRVLDGRTWDEFPKVEVAA